MEKAKGFALGLLSNQQQVLIAGQSVVTDALNSLQAVEKPTETEVSV